jgi:hypothetical protein
MSDFDPTSIHTDNVGAALVRFPSDHTFIVYSLALTLTV